MNRSVRRVMVGVAGWAVARDDHNAGRRARRKCDGADAGCRLCVAFGTRGIPAALDAAITGPATRIDLHEGPVSTRSAHDVVSIGADGAPSYRLETLEQLDRPRQSPWPRHAGRKAAEISHLSAMQHRALMEQLRAAQRGSKSARGINSIEAIKEAGGWRVTGIMLQAESATAPLPKEYLP